MISVRSQVTGPARVDAVPRRRLRQERPAALHDRQAAVRGRAPAGRGQPGARSGAAQPGRGPAGARRGAMPNTPTLTAQRQAQLAENGIVSKDVAEQARAGADAVAGDRQGRPRGGRKRAGAARRPAGDGGQREACSSVTRHPLADRRTQRQPRRQGRRSRHGQPDRADDDRAGRADLRHVLGAGREPVGDQAESRPETRFPSPPRRRTPTPRPSSRASSNFIDNVRSTRPPTRSS